MSDHDAFLHAIRAEPGDDAPRLVFADWLEDNGQPERAELVRVQCELEPVRFEFDRQRGQELLALGEGLQGSCEAAWLVAIGQALRAERTRSRDRGAYGPYFVRGLPELAAVSLEVRLSRGEELLTAYPTLRELAVFDV